MGTQSRFGEGKRENKAWPTRQYVVAGGGFFAGVDAERGELLPYKSRSYTTGG
jgi:hypothetical protein